MAFLHHPVFQSFLLPLLVGLVLAAVLRPAAGRWRAMAPALCLVISLSVWPGFAWPALAHAQMLPWLALGSAAAVAVALARGSTGPARLGARVGIWAAVFVVLAGLALAAWGALGGSLLLAQLALMLSTVSALTAWQAWRMRVPSLLGLWPLWLFALGLALSLAGLPSGTPSGAGDDDPYYSTP